MLNNSFEFSILVRGKPLREYFHNNRSYVEGRSGSDFELLFKNNSNRRIEAVFSVDGLDCLDGSPSNTKKNGYLISAYGQVLVKGWRLNQEEVARFRFDAQEGSYASQKGLPRNVGVIGAAVFYEKEIPRWNYPQWNYWPNYQQNFNLQDSLKGINNILWSKGSSRGGSSSNCSGGIPTSSQFEMSNATFSQGEFGSAAPCSVSNEETKGVEPMNAQGLGTAFGQKESSKVTTVAFSRASETPDSVMEVRYNNKAGLEALGIQVAQPLPKNIQDRESASAFDDLSKGCPPPVGWRG